MYQTVCQVPLFQLRVAEVDIVEQRTLFDEGQGEGNPTHDIVVEFLRLHPAFVGEVAPEIAPGGKS